MDYLNENTSSYTNSNSVSKNNFINFSFILQFFFFFFPIDYHSNFFSYL